MISLFSGLLLSGRRGGGGQTEWEKKGRRGRQEGRLKGGTARVSAEHQVDLPSSTSAPRALCVLIVTRGVRGSLHGGVQPPSQGLKIIYSRALWQRCRYSEVEGCNIWRFSRKTATSSGHILDCSALHPPSPLPSLPVDYGGLRTQNWTPRISYI